MTLNWVSTSQFFRGGGVVRSSRFLPQVPPGLKPPPHGLKAVDLCAGVAQSQRLLTAEEVAVSHVPFMAILNGSYWSPALTNTNASPSYGCEAPNSPRVDSTAFGDLGYLGGQRSRNNNWGPVLEGRKLV